MTLVNKRHRALGLTLRTAVCLTLFVLLNVVNAHAAIRNAASCSSTDVGAAFNSAANGDTIVIPAGTCTWTTNLTLSGKWLTIQGAGIDKTTLVDAVDKSDYPNWPQVLIYNTIDGGLTRITGITFQGGSTSSPTVKGMVVIQGDSHQFRLDHCRFVTGNTPGIFFHGNIQGVLDHSAFTLTNWKYGIYVAHESWNGVGDFGDASWADASYLGTNKAIFVEDNTFDSSDQNVAIDGWAGGHVVFRYNTLRNTMFANHGTETSGRWRSQRSFEVYNNTITFDNMNYASMVAIRGGVGVIFNNVGRFTGAGGANRFADLQYYRSSDQSRQYTPWGFCNGSSVWDGNADSTGYPCLDQPGRGQGTLLSNFDPTPIGWTHQAADPVYAWNNTLNGSPNALTSNADAVVKENRDFYNGTAKPGYTSYTYPHHLTQGSGSTPTPTTPAAPTNLRVVR